VSVLPLTEPLEDQFRQSLKELRKAEDYVTKAEYLFSWDLISAKEVADWQHKHHVAFQHSQSLREKLGDRAYEIEEER
jgi:hypothetical protein